MDLVSEVLAPSMLFLECIIPIFMWLGKGGFDLLCIVEPKLEHPKNITIIAYNRILLNFPMKKKIIPAC